MSISFRAILLALLMLFIHQAYGQQKFTISGYIEDAESGEKLIAANLYEANSESGTVSNTYGFYSITLPKDSVELVFFLHWFAALFSQIIFK
ncbi:MAG: hypothetical protein R2879_13815 [Saprospiraceae bacterium]